MGGRNEAYSRPLVIGPLLEPLGSPYGLLDLPSHREESAQ
jgi:hypothetical protein